MKLEFLEPEVEILNFLCGEIMAPDSFDTELDGDGEDLPILP